MSEDRCPDCNQPYSELELLDVADALLFRTPDGEYRTCVRPTPVSLQRPVVNTLCLTCCPPLSSQEAHWWQDRLGRRLT